MFGQFSNPGNTHNIEEIQMERRRKFWLVLTAIIGGIIISTLAVPFSFGQQTWASGDKRIAVFGEAQVLVEPDILILTLGIENSAEDLDSARMKNEELVSSVIETTHKYNILKKDITIGLLSVNPKGWYDRRRDEKSKNEYKVGQTITLTLHDPDAKTVSQLMFELQKAGWMKIIDFSLRTSKLRVYRDEARDLAVEHAKEKANQLANGFDAKIGKPLKISESYNRWYYGSGFWRYWNYWWEGRDNRREYSSQVVVDHTSEEENGDIPIGRMAVEAKVNVTFQLKY